MVEQNIKDVIKQEFVKCAQDPVYFMKKYYWIQHPQRGRIQFGLYPFQEKVLNLFRNNSYCITNKSRQLGISTLVSAYSLWLMLFNKDKTILVIATKQETAKNMVTKIRFAYDNLPSWLRIKAVEDNKLSLRLLNGSQVKAISASGDAGRSEAVSLLVIDEAAFIENIEEIFASAQQTLATGGGCIAISTPYGTGNWFHKTWIKAQSGENKFVPIKLPWTIHPERTQAWRDEQDELLGPRNAAQECDCDFTTSGDTVIEPSILNFYIESFMKEPMDKRGIDGSLWIWEIPDYSRQYAVIADVARGDGKDFSTFHIIDVAEAKQVGEFKQQVSTRDFGNLLVAIATEYNDALLVIENANVGWAVIQQVIDRGYRNLYYSPKMDIGLGNVEQYLTKFENGQSMVPGFTTSVKTRPLVISKMVSYIHEKACVIQSKRTLEELRTFVWRNGKAQAVDGYNDDLVMAWGIGMFLRDTALTFRQQGLDMVRASINSIYRTGNKSNTPIYSPNNSHVPNPYQMNLPHEQKENIDWLLG